MAFKIGFLAEHTKSGPAAQKPAAQQAAPRKSLVQIRFPQRGMSLTYYNDRFDLRCGDLVYVDGKLEGLRGTVEEVQYNFKIRLADYKQVIAVADTDVHGEFFQAGSHFLSFDPEAIPAAKVRTWFCPPESEDGEVVSGSDGEAFPLEDLKTMKISAATAERGLEYYRENRVRYLAVDGEKGYAIIEGSKIYEVDFLCRNGMISDLHCSCYCCGCCKHEFAAMCQLRELLDRIAKDYPEKSSAYFAAVDKRTLFSVTIDRGDRGRFIL